MYPQLQTKEVTKERSFPVRFFQNPFIVITVYLEHFQLLKGSSLQEKFYVVAYLIRNICLKTLILLISQSN